MSLIVLPGQELTSLVQSEFSNSQPVVNVMKNISETAKNTLATVEFTAFTVQFDQLDCELIGEGYWNIYYSATETEQFGRFWNKLRCCLPTECLKENTNFDLRLNICQVFEEDLDSQMQYVAQTLGCPCINVDKTSLFVQEGEELVELFKHEETPVAATSQFSPLLKTSGRPGFYIVKSKCQVQRVKTARDKARKAKISGTAWLKSGEMIVIEQFSGKRAYVSHPVTGWLNLKDGLVAPKWKKTIPAGFYKLKNDVVLTHKDKFINQFEHYRIAKGTEVKVLESRNSHTPTKLYVVIDGIFGTIPFYEKSGRKYNLNVRPMKNQVYEQQNNLWVAPVNKTTCWETSSTVSAATTALTYDSSTQSWVSESAYSANSACSSNSSTSVNVAAKNEWTATNYREVGLYRPKADIKVYADKNLTTPLKDGKQDVVLRGNNMFEIVEFFDVQSHGRTWTRAEICGPCEGFIRFDGLVENVCKKYPAGLYQLNYMNVEVVDNDYNYVKELRKWSTVQVDSIEGCYAKISVPCTGYIHLGQALLQTTKNAKPTLFFTDLPEELTEGAFFGLLRKQGVVKMQDFRDSDMKFFYPKKGKTGPINCIVKVKSVARGQKALSKAIVFKGLRLSVDWSKNFKPFLN